MYSELRRKVMASVIISLPTAEIIISGTWLTLLLGDERQEGDECTDAKIKLKFEIMSSKTYSGRHLKASGASELNGRL